MDKLDVFSLKAPDSWKDSQIKIIQLGAGGNGSEMLNCLIRIHFGLMARGHESGLHVTVIDDDRVEESNLVRQNFWPSDIGEYKAQCLVEKANYLLGLNWDFMPARFPLGRGFEQGLPNSFDIVITCVDTVSCRKQLFDNFIDVRTEALWLDLGNDKTDGQIVMGHLGKCKNHIPNVIDRFPEIKIMNDKNERPSCSAEESLRRQDLFINQKVAGAGANLLWQLMARGSIANTHIHVDAKTMEELTVG
jgi:PRTRC genetic system ThiF family protein